MDFLRRKYEQLRAFLTSMPTSQRISIGLLAVVVVSALVMLRLELGREDLVPLVTEPELSAEEANAVLKELDKRGVEYELKAGTIRVPPEQRDKLLIEFFGEGIIPADDRVWNWVYEESLTRTPGIQQLQELVTRQKVLERRIASLDPIQSAGVLINPVKESEAWIDPGQATASVTVKLKSGKTLSSTTAKGIIKMVAASVNHLKPSNVTLVDTTGRLYRVPDEDSPLNVPADQLEVKRSWEGYYENKIKEAFEFLPKVTAKVDVVIDFQSRTESTKNSEHKSYVTEDEARTSTGGAEGHTPGGGGNLPTEPAGLHDANATPYVASAGATGGTTSSDELTRTTFETKPIKESETSLIMPPGEPKSISLALVVPLEKAAEMTAAENDALKKGEKTLSDFTDMEPKKAITAKNIQNWKSIAGQILGAKHADNISILPVFFEEPLPPPAPSQWEEFREFLYTNWSRIVLVGLLLLSIALVVHIVRKTTPADVLRELDRLREELAAEEKLAAEGVPTEITDMNVARM
ncbi:MAG: hypothetical protein RDV41_13145, partial [Planctomycetota bacterium]|nr:hypothetical protein [Planctomycetota bacterium]